jgi:hypothetical protein
MSSAVRLAVACAVVALLSGCGKSKFRETYDAPLSAVAGVDSKATGNAFFTLSEDGSVLHYSVEAQELRDVTEVNVYMGEERVAALLESKVSGDVFGEFAQGKLSPSDLEGPLAGHTIGDLLAKIQEDQIEVAILTQANPKGELRGKVHR